MSDFNFPLSGAVTQSINPWEFWIKSLSNQMGFINIRNVSTSDHEVEQKIIEEVASYGRQLGRINDVLTTIIEKPDLQHLTEKEKKTIKVFQQMVADIEDVKKNRKSTNKLMSALDTVVSEIKEMQSEHPDLYEQAVKQIKDGLKLESKSSKKAVK